MRSLPDAIHEPLRTIRANPIMKEHVLTNTEMRRLQTNQETLAEELAADAYNYKTALASNFDAARKTGAVMESKSTVSQYETGASGRFRLRKPQHEDLTLTDREGSARYVFVLFDVSSRPVIAHMVEKRPATIGRLIGARGGWNQAGKGAPKRHKLPWSELFDL